MKKALITCAVIAGLTACASPDKMYYEVTARSADAVSIQANKGNMKPDHPMIAKMAAHMDDMAVTECQGMGKSGTVFASERRNTTGPYHSWIERTYRCR